MKKSYLLLHLAVILAGFTGVFGKLITLNEGLLVWYRMLFASVMLLAILRLRNNKINFSFREKITIGKVGLLIMTHWVLFYASIKYANVSIGVVCYCLTSFFTAIFEPLINKRKLVPTELALSALTLLGISLIFHFDTSYQLGIAIGTVSSAFAALYTIFNQRLVKQHDSKVINYYQMLSGTLVLGLLMPLYLYYFPTSNLFPSLSDLIYLLLLALFCTVFLYVLFAESLKHLSAFTVNLSFNLEPIYAIILAFWLFKEGKEVNTSFYIGCLFVMASVVLQSVIARRRLKMAKIKS
ncbi:DMT family transporter [Olivibacter sp. CPCC 100613]|uniref:DMT family transporter n=1 Tax=Olivibacter sp. CPCC 100613 TaxID=3079931 RepID=UPI002FF721C3